MNYKTLKGLFVFIMLCVSYPSDAQVVKIIKSVSKGTPTTNLEKVAERNISEALGVGVGSSALGKIDALRQSGVELRNLSGKVEETIQKRIPVVQRRWESFRSSGFFDAILPTPSKELKINLINPTNEQVQQAVKGYQRLWKDFAPLHAEVTTKLFYNTFPNEKGASLPPQDRRTLITNLGLLQGRAEKLSRVVFAKDPALKNMLEWLENALQAIHPFYVPGLQQRARTDSRVFERDEFFLKYPDTSHFPEGFQGPERAVPDNLRVAVLNDQEDILDMYRIWNYQKRLGEGWDVQLYEDTGALLDDIRAGKEYDLIITDLTVPGGGGYFLVDQIRSMKLNMPIIGCSMYTIDKLNAEKMFDQGFDGYIYGSDMFEEVSGSVKFIGYLKNYYYYKALNGWSR